MTGLFARLQGTSIGARALRSSFLTVGGFGFAQFLRLVSNLILTRLLFPEAFGLMSLVMVILMGLAMFSDVGTTAAILQSRRGDDPDFLNTAWTIQVMRGFALWLTACVLAWPLALVYEEPLLGQLLPVAALTLVIAGFKPTRMDTANRHLLLGRVTFLEVITQATGMIAAVLLAWMTGSVWALVLSGIIGNLVEVILNSRFLPGPGNRFRWQPESVRELVSFGKWIFLATVCGFFFGQGDKLLMGAYLALDVFGVYNIGFFLASFPMLLGGMITRKILIPIYRETPPTESAENFAKLRKMRFLVTAALMSLVTLFAILGVWLVEVMYDPRYAMAGPVVVIIACMQMPQIIVQTYDQAAVAAGDSKRFFILSAARAALMIGCMVIGLEVAGLIGGLFALGAAYTLVYPVVVWLAQRAGAWDPAHDAFFAVVGLIAASFSFWLNWNAIETVLVMGFG